MSLSRNIYKVTRRVRARRGPHLAVAILRLLLGFAFLPAGLKKLLGQPFTDATNHGAFHNFLHAFHDTGGFYRFVGVVQLVIAMLLLTQRAAWAGAAMAIPVLTAIFALCVSTGALPTATVVALMLLGSVGLVLWELPVLRARLRGESPFPPLVNDRWWIACGVAIVVAYATLCLVTGEIYRPRKVNPGDPAFYIMPLIALLPLATWLIERRRRAPSQLVGYDYFDFGCSSGANIELIAKLSPSSRGLGLDNSASKIAIAVNKGLHAINFDILKIPNEKLVEFVTMSHFLEHLDSVGQARNMIAKSIHVAREFVVIRQPWFDSDGELLQLGLKFFWSHWGGHSNRMSAIDFMSILNSQLSSRAISGFLIAGRSKVVSAKDSSLLPLRTKIDQHHYDRDRHGPKSAVALGFKAYKEIIVLIDISGGYAEHPVVTHLQPLHVLFSAGSLAQKD